MTTSTKRF